MNVPTGPMRKSSIFIKNFQLTSSLSYQDYNINMIPSLLSIKKKIKTQMLSKYDFSREAFYKLKITQILNRKSIPYAHYRERLIVIDIKEFLKQEYIKEEIPNKLNLIILINSYLFKEYPNYLVLNDIYPILQLNMMQKQKLLNDNYHLLIDQYRIKSQFSNGNKIINSDLFDDSQSFDESKYYDPIFYNNQVNRSDSIGSIENFVKYIDNIEKGYNDNGNGLLRTPLLRSKKSKQRRIGAMFSIIKKMTSFDLALDNIDIFSFGSNHMSSEEIMKKLSNRPKNARPTIKEDNDDLLINSFSDSNNQDGSPTQKSPKKAMNLFQQRIKKNKTNSYQIKFQSKLSERNSMRSSLNSNSSITKKHTKANENTMNVMDYKFSTIRNNISPTSNSLKFAKTSKFLERMKNRQKMTKELSSAQEQSNYDFCNSITDIIKKEREEEEKGMTLSPPNKIGLVLPYTNKIANNTILLKNHVIKKATKDCPLPLLNKDKKKRSNYNTIQTASSSVRYKVSKNTSPPSFTPLASPIIKVPKSKLANSKVISPEPFVLNQYTMTSPIHRKKKKEARNVKKIIKSGVVNVNNKHVKFLKLKI